MDEINWEHKYRLLKTLKKTQKNEDRRKINRIISSLNELGRIGADIHHKPSQFSFSSYGNIFELRRKQNKEPQLIKGRVSIFNNIEVKENIPHEADFYVYKNNLYVFEAYAGYNSKEQKILIKQHYFNRKKKFAKIKKEIDLLEKLEKLEIHKSREPIPEEVRFAVWRRDGGKCVKCGTNEKLEFDHIIPISKGGSNTERNIQLLCEKCNREKSDKI